MNPPIAQIARVLRAAAAALEAGLVADATDATLQATSAMLEIQEAQWMRRAEAFLESVPGQN